MTADISTEDFELFHYGVKGMKWGVRKDGKSSGRKARYSELRNKGLATLELTAKNGKQVRVTQDRNSKFVDFVSSLSKKGTESAYDRASFTFEADGKKVGEASFDKVSSDELNLVWLGINKNERGQGYASAVFDAAVQYGKSEGVDRLTLEVPGNAPDARHIYAKQGFTVTKEPTSKEIKSDPIWGGLTHMELDLTKEQIRHSALTDDELLEKAFDETFTPLPPDVEADIFGDSEIEHSSEDLELFHYGVKGMKWGVRKDEKWSKRKSKKITDKAYKKSKKDLDKFSSDLTSKRTSYTKSGKLSSDSILAYNRKMSELMTDKVKNLKSPSGKSVTFVAKRGRIGVFMALADEGYNMDQLKNGLFESGKVGYKNQTINKI